MIIKIYKTYFSFISYQYNNNKRKHIKIIVIHISLYILLTLYFIKLNKRKFTFFFL